jgi:hypothetical protein
MDDLSIGFGDEPIGDPPSATTFAYNPDYPPVPSGGGTFSDALGIFKSISAGTLDLAKSIGALETGVATSSANAAIAKNQLQTQQTLSQLQAQGELAKAQAALKPSSSLLPLLMIGGAIFALAR